MVVLRHVFRLLALFVGVIATYLLLLAFPEPLFPVATAHAGVTIRSRTPLDAAASARLTDRVLERVAASELYDRRIRHRIFVIDDPTLWGLFNGPYQRAIARNCDLGNAIFLPGLDLTHNRIVHFDGRSADAVGILAHEMMHTFMERRVGPRYWTLPWWKREGYPEYVGSVRCARLESPPAYRDAAWAWKRLLEDRGMTFDQVVATPMTLAEASR